MRDDIKRSIDQWANEPKFYPGGFVTAVLENNLREALGRADEDNRQDIFDIVSYCYNEIPEPCWGSEEKMKAWFLLHNPPEEPDATVE